MRDSLVAHCRATADVDWERPTNELQRRMEALAGFRGLEVAHERYIEMVDRARGEQRAERMHLARVAMVRMAHGGCVMWHRLKLLQAIILGREAAFRTGPAFAKKGRERYGYGPGLEALFEEKLARDGEDGAHPVAKAVRVYLDVCFFHPFDDGNARAARLAFDWTLERGGFGVVSVAPVFGVERVAGDRAGYVDFLRLVVSLGEANARQAGRYRSSHGVPRICGS